MDQTMRSAAAADVDTMKQIAVETQLFGSGEVAFFDEMIVGAHGGTMPDNHWLVVEASGGVVAAAYYAPEPFSDR